MFVGSGALEIRGHVI